MCMHLLTCLCVQMMKDQLASPSAVAQAERKNKQALLGTTVKDRYAGLEPHLVSANSRYIQEQQEQQQVKTKWSKQVTGCLL